VLEEPEAADGEVEE